MSRLIVVVGANRRQGSSVIDALLEYPDEWRIRAISVDPTSLDMQALVRRGVDMCKCDINNREECCQAFAGAYGVFALNNYWDATTEKEDQQVRNLIEAAKASNIQHFIASSLPHSEVLERDFLNSPSCTMIKTQLERSIEELQPDASFPHVTFIHGSFFYQSLMTFFVLGTPRLEFRYPILPNARTPFYDIRDTGKVVRECFRHPDQWGNRHTVPIVAENLSMEQIFSTIQEVTGKDVRFVSLSYDEALLKLHRETVNNLKWYNELGSFDERQIEKTTEIWPHMKTFADVLQETRWFME